ncbi:MAG: macro domain-containing protein [Rhodospirillaceae bacterium]|nr:macro domain-containing protein [Rhodospirillaceae bacterium]
MIKEVEGDILMTQAAVIAHGVAPADHFDSGLARALRERFPAMAKDFRHYCQQNHPKAGETWIWAGADAERGTVCIANLMTQEPAPSHHGAKPGRASLDHVGHALRALAKEAKAQNFHSIALPRLATGVGGLDWAAVKPLIERHLGDLGIPVIVYSAYRPGARAEEGLGAAAR